jgi:hypothetical protein
MTNRLSHFTDTVNVKDWGATGDGSTDDVTAIQAAISYAWSAVVGDGQAVSRQKNKPVYFPAGTYLVSAPLTMPGPVGTLMYGDGMWTTKVVNTAATSVMVTNGGKGCVFKDFSLWCGLSGASVGTDACFDLDHDGTSYTSQQQCRFENMQFQGGKYGLAIARTSTVNCSEHVILNCQFEGRGANNAYGISTWNFNALNQSVMSCAVSNYSGTDSYGINCDKGSLQQIENVTFVANNYDVFSNQGTYMTLSSCRSESANFLSTGNSINVLIGCIHTSGSNGVFVTTNQTTNPTIILGCLSQKGTIYLPSGLDNDADPGDWFNITASGSLVMNTQFGRDDCFTSGSEFKFWNVTTGNASGVTTGNQRMLSYGTFGGQNDIQNDAVNYHDPGVGILSSTAANIATNGAIGGYTGSGATVFTVTLASTHTLTDPTNLTPGMNYQWVITQSTVGSNTLAYGSAFTFPGGSTLAILSTAASAVDVVTGFFDGSKLRCELVKAYTT